MDMALCVKEEPLDYDGPLDSPSTALCLEIKEEPESYFDDNGKVTRNSDLQEGSSLDGSHADPVEEEGATQAVEQTVSRTSDQEDAGGGEGVEWGHRNGAAPQRTLRSSKMRLRNRDDARPAGNACVVTPPQDHSRSTGATRRAGRDGSRPHACRVCDASFRFKYCLTRHLVIHSGVKPHVCGVCGWSFFDKSNLTAHYKKHYLRRFKCGVCCKLFLDSEALERHARSKHGIKKPIFGCAVCGVYFKCRNSLKKHSDQHEVCISDGEDSRINNLAAVKRRDKTVDAVVGDDSGPGGDDSGAGWPEDARSARIGPSSQVPVQTHPKKGLFSCHICGVSLSRMYCLQRHMRIHTGYKPYRCNVCGKVFSDRSNLQGHSKIHTGGFRCDTCGQTFARRCALRWHGRLHGPKPFACRWCGDAFQSKKSLQLHVRKHHEEIRHVISAASSSGIRVGSADAPMQVEDGNDVCVTGGDVDVSKVDSSTACVKTQRHDKRNPRGESRTTITKTKSKRRVNTRRETRQKRYMCVVCRAPFTNVMDLADHYNSHLTADTPGAYIVTEVVDPRDDEGFEARGVSLAAEVPDEDVVTKENNFSVGREAASGPYKTESRLGVDKESSDLVPTQGDGRIVTQISEDCTEGCLGEVQRTASGGRAEGTGREVMSAPETLGNMELAVGKDNQGGESCKAGPSDEASSGTSSSPFGNDGVPDACSLRSTTYSENAVSGGGLDWQSCTLCEQQFASYKDLLGHCKKHAKKGAFPCFICGIKMSRLQGLKRHVVLHTGEKPYKCSVCGRAFSDKSNYYAHCRRRASGIGKNRCCICGTIYQQSRSLKRHFRKHHTSQPQES